MEYLPKRYNATSKQECDRQVIYNFKNGSCPLFLMNKIVAYIKYIKSAMEGNNIRVCFIPASTCFKTIIRYNALATYIEKETGIACSINTIMPKVDHEAGHIAGKKDNPAEDFKFRSQDIIGENIILIDDIITRGTTFVKTATQLQYLGAKNILGIFLAKTINPNWVGHCA